VCVFCVLFAEAFEISPGCKLSKCIRCIRNTTGAGREDDQILAGRVWVRLPGMLRPTSTGAVSYKHSATRIATLPVAVSTTLKSTSFSIFIWRRKQSQSPKHFVLRAGHRKTDKISELNNNNNLAPKASPTDLPRVVCSGLRIGLSLACCLLRPFHYGLLLLVVSALDIGFFLSRTTVTCASAG
jgi:hypothetical protein